MITFISSSRSRISLSLLLCCPLLLTGHVALAQDRAPDSQAATSMSLQEVPLAQSLAAGPRSIQAILEPKPSGNRKIIDDYAFLGRMRSPYISYLLSNKLDFRMQADPFTLFSSPFDGYPASFALSSSGKVARPFIIRKMAENSSSQDFVTKCYLALRGTFAGERLDPNVATKSTIRQYASSYHQEAVRLRELARRVALFGGVTALDLKYPAQDEKPTLDDNAIYSFIIMADSEEASNEQKTEAIERLSLLDDIKPVFVLAEKLDFQDQQGRLLVASYMIRQGKSALPFVADSLEKTGRQTDFLNLGMRVFVTVTGSNAASSSEFNRFAQQKDTESQNLTDIADKLPN